MDLRVRYPPVFTFMTTMLAALAFAWLLALPCSLAQTSYTVLLQQGTIPWGEPSCVGLTERPRQLSQGFTTIASAIAIAVAIAT